MNHKITTDYMLEGLQDRIDKIAFEIWSRKYNTEQLERENNKSLNRKYAR